MGKIFCIMGKSSSGKDTIFKKLLEDPEIDLKTIVPYTTRPIRKGEDNGVEYCFVTDDEVEELDKKGKIIELREYETFYGVWKYFTVADSQIDLSANSYIVIGTLESYEKIRDYFGRDKVAPIYIELDAGVRIQRALDREKLQKTPKFEEMCRRFLADEKDFSEEKLKKAGIEKIFYNDNLEHCIEQIKGNLKQ